jgi:DNA-directed RNA polymerase subunit RPC12/RpoP
MSGTLSYQGTKDRAAHAALAPAADDVETGVLVCRRCGSDEVTRSHRRKWERPLGWIGILPYRCLRCWGRFYQSTGATSS